MYSIQNGSYPGKTASCWSHLCAHPKPRQERRIFSNMGSPGARRSGRGLGVSNSEPGKGAALHTPLQGVTK